MLVGSPGAFVGGGRPATSTPSVQHRPMTTTGGLARRTSPLLVPASLRPQDPTKDLGTSSKCCSLPQESRRLNPGDATVLCREPNRQYSRDVYCGRSLAYENCLMCVCHVLSEVRTSFKGRKGRIDTVHNKKIFLKKQTHKQKK